MQTRKGRPKSHDSVVHRRNPVAPEGSNIELMDEERIWPLRQFVHVVQEDEEDA